MGATEQPEVLQGIRVLIVEDALLVAQQLEMVLVEAGCVVVGHAGRLGDAQRLARERLPDAAVLDINLHGELVYPLAEELAGRGVPFIFVTGYGEAVCSREAFAGVPIVSKPFAAPLVIAALEQAVRSGREQ